MKSLKNSLHISIRTKLIGIFLITSILIFGVNMYVYSGINQMIDRIDNIYESNAGLNELQNALSALESSMTEYLNTKSSDSLESYYITHQSYSDLVGNLNDRIVNSDTQIMEKNIAMMSQSYLDLTMETVDAKRGRNVEKYKALYEESEQMYSYINTYIYSLNNIQFENNTFQYEKMLSVLTYSENVNILILLFAGILNILLVFMLTSSIVNPLKQLADSADRVSEGNLDIALLPSGRNDEIGIVTKAFNQMVVSLREYIEQIKRSMEKENEMKERELLMETHLKDAKLKYLQAQINPHFLFNTLNAGAQLAMMEGADKTYSYVQNVADFFRYNVKKEDAEVTLADEIDLVDHYIYILNVRFSGEIQYHKTVDESLIHVLVPPMILQPLVENAVNYGIREIDREGIIELSVEKEDNRICVSVRDNGVGIPQEKIDAILTDRIVPTAAKDSNGVGLNNVMNRLRLYFKTDDVIEITSSGTDMGTEVAIFIPIKD